MILRRNWQETQIKTKSLTLIETKYFKTGDRIKSFKNSYSDKQRIN